jgi:hypothetical protein
MVALLSLRVKTKPKCNKNATATQTKKETTVVVYATTVPDTTFAEDVGADVQGGALLFFLVG